MSVIDYVLKIISPIGNAEASPLWPDSVDYPKHNVEAANKALASGMPLDEVWKKFKLYPWKDYAGKTTLLGEIPDTNAALKTNEQAREFPGIVNTLIQGGLTQSKEPFDQTRVDTKVGNVLYHPELMRNNPLLHSLPLYAKTAPIKGTIHGYTIMNDVNNADKYGEYLLDQVNGNEHYADNQADGQFFGKTKKPSYIVANGNTNSQLLSTVLHELVHASAAQHGMNMNVANMKGTMSKLQAYLNDPHEELARQTQIRLNYSPKQLHDESPATTTEKTRKTYKSLVELRKLLKYN